MTSTLKGIEPPLPTGTRTFPLPPTPSRTSSHSHQPPPRSWPRQPPTPKPTAPAHVNHREAAGPPQKKAKLKATAGSHVNGATATHPPALDLAPSNEPTPDVEQGRKASRVSRHPLVPLRPGGSQSLRAVQRNRPLAVERAARKDAVPVKAYVPEPPPCAPRYHEAGPADFSPWTGHHAEDVLNELTTRQGFYDKIQVSQNESGTARPSVWSSLKHKSGLQILSSLFVSALDQRQCHGSITANSTFKPPPRVTLTDTKREAWLRDLANPLIPLRRLSRTIPHGIRGRILLDHCLSKDIPTSRAIWLAKCVGANEIRAFKRKGTGGVFTVGGEAKWIKDWTANIEQFLESIVVSCGSPGWRMKMNYGLRLASHLYSEHLLDQDHYLTWMIGSFESSDLDSLPIWLLVQQIHQQETLQHRQRGRRLAGAVLEHLYNANLTRNREVYKSILQQLVRLSRTIMASAPACFLLPDKWDKYAETLKTCSMNRENDRLQYCFESLSRRNECLQNHGSWQHKHLRNSLKQRLIQVLDTLSLEPDYGKIARTCFRITHDGDVLVNVCVEWSCSIYRHGIFRSYAAARLLRIWSRLGIELQQPVFDFLASTSSRKDLGREDLYRLLAGLVSSRHFSVGRYLQWLMARGTLRGRSKRRLDYPCDIGLLFELPLQGLPVHVVNLRQTLVSSATETSEDDEGQVSISAKAQISKQVPGFFSQTHNSSDISQPTIDLSQLSQTVKSDIARWIRQTVIVRLSDDDSVTDPEDYEHSKNPRDSPTSIMSFDDFLGLRRVLEDLVDFNILADVLNLVSDQAHGPLLTAVADTVNFYFDIFNAIGAADGLFRKLYKNVEIGQSQEIETDFLESLIDLGSRLPKADQEIRRLRKELSAHAPKFPTAACSPISDTMVEAVQSTEPTFADEMDQILASGNSMDEQTLTRVFGTISRHLEKSFEESSLLTIRFSHLLLTLRGFGPRVFDVLIKDWLDKWLQSSDPSRGLFVSLSPMICSKVVPLKMVLQAIVRTVEIESSQSRKTDLLLDTFEMIMGSRSERMTAVCYRRYRIFDQLQIMMQATPAAVVSIVQKAAELVRATSSATGLRTGRHIRGDAVVGLAQLIIVQQFEAATVADSTPKDLDLDSHTLDALGTILYLCEPTRPAQLGIHDDIVRVFRSINDLNVSLFTLKLKAIFTSAMTAARESTDDLARVFIEQATIIPDDHVSLRACLVSELSASQASSVRNLAEGLVLTWATNDTGSALIETEKRISSLISIVEASAFCVSAAETSPLVERIADILTGILPISQHPDYESRSDTDSEYLFRRLDILLRLLVVHQSTIQHPKYPQQLCYHLLMALSLLLVSPRLGSQTVLLHRTFDILCLLTDSVSDDTRLRCIRSLRDSQCLRDSRLQFIFGYSDTVESEWLQLVTKSAPAAETKPAAPAPATSKPYPLRRWEMMQDATPVATENDTNLSLTLFGSRKSVL